jgi:hypothetical protein
MRQCSVQVRKAGLRRQAPNDSMSKLDVLEDLRQQARRELSAESRKHATTAKLRQIDLRVNELHFALFVILFSAMFKFGGYYPLAQHPPQFGQVVFAVSTNE